MTSTCKNSSCTRCAVLDDASCETCWPPVVGSVVGGPAEVRGGRVKPSELCRRGRRSLSCFLGDWVLKLLSAWHEKKVPCRRIQSSGPGSGPEIARRHLGWRSRACTFSARPAGPVRPSWWCSGAAPSSTGARVTATVTSRLRSCRLRQQLQLARRPSWLNRCPWSTKELEDIRGSSSVVHGSIRTYRLQARSWKIS